MTTHRLKTWLRYFEAVWEGRKTFEVRKNDRNFQEGDRVVLREYTRITDQYSGREVHATIGYVFRGEDFPVLDGDAVVFSLVDPTRHGRSAL